MNWRLGLDLGTNSIGWAALQLDERGQVSGLIDMGVRIFSDGRDPKTGEPLAVKRRKARLARRMRMRKNRRKRAMLNLLIRSGLLKAEESKQIELLNPYECRALAAQGKVTSEQLSRALLNICSHRGFKSNRKEELAGNKEKKEESSKNKPKIEALSGMLGTGTLGQFLLDQIRKGEMARFRPASSLFYPSRAMYEHEFKTIRDMQRVFFPDFDWDKAHRIIFFQRPLKPQERGRCEFMRDEYRAFKALPSAHRFRILSEINNLTYIDQRGCIAGLSDEEKEKLFEKLESQKTVAFGTIRKMLGNLPETAVFNLENERRESLSGNKTSCDMRKEDMMGTLWDMLKDDEQDELVELLITEDDEDKIRERLKRYNLADNQIANIIRHEFETGVSSLCAKVMRECVRVMKTKHLRYDEAMAALGFHHSKRTEGRYEDSLPYYGQAFPHSMLGADPDYVGDNPEKKYGKINNPTVHVALNQLRWLVNALIKRFGKPEEIALEVARELKLSQRRKDEIKREQKKNQDRNLAIKEDLVKLGLKRPTGDDVKKYRLWKELGEKSLSSKCLYCGRTISAHELLSDLVEVEHILPFSRTLNDSIKNLTVAHKTCNNFKLNKTPYEAFHTSPQGFNWNEILERARLCGKSYLFSADAMKPYENLENRFIARQITDNAYLSRFAKGYLSIVCPENKIWTSSGKLTFNARAQWGFNTILNASHDTWYKNRSDHRHHALDALTVGLMDRGIIQKAANKSKRSRKLEMPDCPLQRNHIEAKIKEVVVSIKPDHRTEGQLLEETALGRRLYRERLEFKDFKESDARMIVSEKKRKQALDIIETDGFKKGKEKLRKLFPLEIYVSKLVSTMPVTDLTVKDLYKAERVIADIDISDNLRTRWEKHLGKRILSAAEEKSEWDEFIRKYSTEMNIRNIRYFPKDQQNEISIKSCGYFKAYMPYDYLYVEVWEMPGNRKGQKGKYIGVYINRIEAKGGNIHQKPHPAAKKVMKLYKEDVISIEKQSRKTFARIAGFSATAQKIDIRPLNAADSIEEWLNETNQSLTDDFWKPKSGKNYVAINTIFNAGTVRKLVISVDGRILNR